MPYDAYVSVRAILRTVWRMGFSHRHLLQWNPSETNTHGGYQTLGSSVLLMWIAPVVSFVLFFYLTVLAPTALLAAAPVLLFWSCSAGIVWEFSKPIVNKKETLSENQNAYLHRLSRKTWAFFETFVKEEDNWLPPDNFKKYLLRKLLIGPHRQILDSRFYPIWEPGISGTFPMVCCLSAPASLFRHCKCLKRTRSIFTTGMTP